MPSLFDPLSRLYSLGAYPHIETLPNGTKHITLTFARTSTRKGQRLAQAFAVRFERLLLMQLDVHAGHQPRTVQQLVAAKKLKVVAGRYVAT